MKILTQISFKIEGHPEYNNEIGLLTNISDNFDWQESNEFIEETEEDYRAALDNAADELTEDLIAILRLIAKEREKE